MTVSTKPRFHQKWIDVHQVSVKDWALQKPVIFQGSKGDCIVVPRGFVTDYASVPRILHSLVGPTGIYTLAAIVHDWLLKLLLGKKWTINSRDADGLFRLMLEVLGVGFWLRWFMWTGVRWAALKNPSRRAGWWSWKETPILFAMSLIALPVILPIIVGVGIGYICMLALQLVAFVARVR